MNLGLFTVKKKMFAKIQQGHTHHKGKFSQKKEVHKKNF